MLRSRVKNWSLGAPSLTTSDIIEDSISSIRDITVTFQAIDPGFCSRLTHVMTLQQDSRMVFGCCRLGHFVTKSVCSRRKVCWPSVTKHQESKKNAQTQKNKKNEEKKQQKKPSLPTGKQTASSSGKRAFSSAPTKQKQASPKEGVESDAAYATTLRNCGYEKDLSAGKLIHARLADARKDQETYLGNMLVQMYGKCGSLQDSRAVFDRIHTKNVYSWTLMISAYVQNRHYREALELYKRMNSSSCSVIPDSFIFSSILGACGELRALAEGRAIHARILSSEEEPEPDFIVSTALVDMYAKCGSLWNAREVFDQMPWKDVVCWSAMIGAYAQHGHNREAMEIYRSMDLEGVRPNIYTFANILGACVCEEALAEGMAIHGRIVACSLDSALGVQNALLSMYAECGCLHGARKIFDSLRRRDVISWNAMIGAYAQLGHIAEALELYRRMVSDGEQPNALTFAAIVGGCSNAGALAEGRLIHSRIIACGLESNVVVGTALVDMYGKSGSLEDARSVFEKMHTRDVVAWTAMINAHIQQGNSAEALELYREMESKGVAPDAFTFSSVLGACSNSGGLAEGKAIHARSIDMGLDSSVTVQNAVVNMYAKCGSLNEARNIFKKMVKRDLVSWNVVIAAYAQYGHGDQALEFFREMKLDGVQHDEITLTSVLHACSHAGLLNEAQDYIFLSKHDGLRLVADHYSCMIDLLARAGWLKEAEDLILNMPVMPNAIDWLTLLGACRVHNDVDRAIHAGEKVLEQEPHEAVPYVMLSNMFAAAGRWEDVAKVTKIMDDKKLKEAGCHREL